MNISAIRIAFFSLFVILAACAQAGDFGPNGPSDNPENPPEYAALWRDLPGPTILDRASTIAAFEAIRQNYDSWQLVDLEVGGLPDADREIAGLWRLAQGRNGETERVHYDLERTVGGLDIVLAPGTNLLSSALNNERADGFELVDLEISANGLYVSGIWHPGVVRHEPVFDLTWSQLQAELAIRRSSQTLVDIEAYYDGGRRFATLWSDHFTEEQQVHRFAAADFVLGAGDLFDQDLRPIDLETYVGPPNNPQPIDDVTLTPRSQTEAEAEATERPVYWVVGIWHDGSDEDWWLHKAEWGAIVLRDTDLNNRPLIDGGPLTMLDLDLATTATSGTGNEPMPLDHDDTTGDADL